MEDSAQVKTSYLQSTARVAQAVGQKWVVRGLALGAARLRATASYLETLTSRFATEYVDVDATE